MIATGKNNRNSLLLCEASRFYNERWHKHHQDASAQQQEPISIGTLSAHLRFAKLRCCICYPHVKALQPLWRCRECRCRFAKWTRVQNSRRRLLSTTSRSTHHIF